MKKKSVKTGRINEEVYRTLSEIIRSEVKDPRISPITSITAAEVTSDLKLAKVYVSVFGNEEDMASTMEGLNSSCGFIRRQLARKLNLRNTPELHFVADSSIAYGMKMSKMIDEIVAKEGDSEHEIDAR